MEIKKTYTREQIKAAMALKRLNVYKLAAKLQLSSRQTNRLISCNNNQVSERSNDQMIEALQPHLEAIAKLEAKLAKKERVA